MDGRNYLSVIGDAAGSVGTGNVRVMGIPDRFIAHASRSAQLAECGLDCRSLVSTMRQMVADGNRERTQRFV